MKVQASYHGKPLVIVADDNPVVRSSLRRAMEQDGYEVLEAADGEKCLQICQVRSPDIILLDALMPLMDGFTCCESLQTVMRGIHYPPILMITSLEDVASVDLAFEVGATDYIIKPIPLAILRHRVRRLLQSNWVMQELLQQVVAERQLKEQLEQANEQLKRLVNIDGLTQVTNRRYFDEVFQREWRRSAREKIPLSLILIDVDFFKQYNDTYGHLAGDECLKTVVKVMASALKRPADLIARYGGEEFVALLPKTELSGAIQLGETMQKKLASQAIPHIKSPINQRVTLSMGVVSTLPTATGDPNSLLAAADKLLYRAKTEGKNRVIGMEPV